jgi:hypothetical protein
MNEAKKYGLTSYNHQRIFHIILGKMRNSLAGILVKMLDSDPQKKILCA